MDRSIVKELPEYTSEVIEKIKVEIEGTEVAHEALDAGWMETSENLYDTSLVVCKEELSENRLASERLNKGIVMPLLTNGTCKDTADTQNTEDLSKCLKYTSLNNMGCLNLFANIEASPANSTPPLEYFIEILPIHNNQGNVSSTKHKSNIRHKPKTIEKHKKFKKNNKNTIEVRTDSKSHIQSLDIEPLNAIIKNNTQPSQNQSLLRKDVFENTYLSKVPTIDNRSTPLQYKTDKNLLKHNSNRVSINSSADKHFACNFCSYKCSIKTSIVRHMRSHTGEKPFSCEICDYRCSQMVSLVLHMRTHNGIKPFSCEMCDYKGSRKEHLDRHMKIHAAGKIYLCNHCKFKSMKRSSLVQHLGTHTTEKPYACDLCSYKCRHKCLLAKHKKVHTGEKPFSCNICHYRCGIKSALIRHKRTHTGEKPYACNICDYRSSRNEHLVRHMKIHPAGKLLSCDLCSFKCGLQRSLLRHIKSHL